MFFPRQSNLSTSPFTAAHHTSRLALTLVASLLLAACGSSTPAPATPTPTPLLAPNLSDASAQTYTQNTAITALVFTNTGGDVTASTGCAVDTSDSKPNLPTGLSVEVVTDSGKRTCQITGTPTEVISTARTVTITATNTTGSASATVSITVNPAATPLAAPNLQVLGAQSYPTGAPVNVGLANDGGGELTGCSVNNPLPNGLSVTTNTGNDSCVITGTPDTAVIATDYDITATNITDSSSVTVSIAVISGGASFATPEALVYVAGDSVDESFTNTATVGGSVSACTGDTLPAGLSVAAIASPGNGCALTGIATATTEQASYTITATNDNGDTTLTLNITVNPAAPNLQAPDAQSYPTGAPVSVELVNSGGGELTGCSANNPLPNGLSVTTNAGNDSCVITGTPDTAVIATDLEITATNITDSSAVTVSIAVVSGGASFATPEALVYVAGDSVDESFTNTATVGGSVSACTGDTLPAGLSVAAIASPGNGCALTGIATATTEQASYTITATNDNGDTTLTLNITVNPAAPNLSAVNAQTYTQNTAITALVLTNTGGDVTASTGCAVDTSDSKPELPAGLMVEVVTDSGKRTCQITGTPTEVISTARTVTITATNTTGSASATVSITVNPAATPLAAPSLQTLVVAQSYPTGALVNVALMNTGGGELTECTVNNTLPSGLSVARNTGNDSCEITGTPDTVTPAADFEITATNITGSSLPVTVNIAVVSGIASFEPPSPDPLVYAVGDSVNEIFANTNAAGSRVSACASTETLPDGLSVAATAMPGNGCVLTGTATTITAQAAYTITATNDNGDASLTLDITINPAAPSLQALVVAQSYPTGAPVNVALMNTGGGELTGCSANNPLPNGLSVTTNAGNDSCEITGTPDTVTPAADFEITATNVTGPSTVTVSIAVVSGIASFEPPSPDPLVYAVGDSVNEIFANTNAAGSRVSACASTETLPDGLSVAATAMPGNGCVLTGTATTITAQAAYTITATNDNGDASLTLDITINPAAPSLQAPDAQSYPTGAPVSVELVNTGGGELTGCSANNPLPNGLSVTTNAGNDSCEITGTPDTVTPAADFEITATNVTGSSLPVTVSIAVVSGVASFTTPEVLVYEVGDSVNVNFINTNTVGSRVSSCAGTLPDGLSIDATAMPGNGCALTGTATTITAQAAYTITATNDNGDASLTLDITINPAAPSLQAPDAQSYPTGALVSVELVNTGGGELTECTVNNPLPNGLSVARNTGNDSCEITGTPDTATPAADFEITATNITDSSMITVSIAVVSGIASFTPPEALVYAVGDIVSESFANTNTVGSRVNTCAGTLPDGLSIDATAMPGNGCALTGTATTITAQAAYTITATNDNGDASLTLDITINPAAPSLQAPDAQSYPTGALVSVELVNTGGGELTECTVNNPLPNGLSVARNTGNDSCEITGTPDTATPAADFEITATNITDSSMITVSIAVVSGIASFTPPEALVYAVGDIVSESFANTATVGGRVNSCAGTLPAGLSVAATAMPGNGCALTGTATAITAQAAYTITVSNDNGDASLTLDITVNPATPNLQTPDAQSYPTGALVSVELVNAGGGELTGCSANNPLPNGLSVTTNAGNDSCEITGTPDTVTPAADFEITATNVTGSSLPVTVNIAVVSGVASFEPPSPDPLVYAVGDSVNEIFANTNAAGSRVSACASTETLPDGLSVAATAMPGNGCVLTGTPTTITAQAAYTITVSNDNGDASLTLDITVNPATPNLQTLGEQSYPTGAPVNVALMNTGGGELTECTVNNTLPNGLSVARNTGNDSCEITGTPDTVTPAADFEITATNVTGSSLPVTVNIAVVSGVASFEPPSPDPLVYAVGDSVNEIFANTNAAGSRVSACASTETLPDGLSVAATAMPGNGCVLTGTPTTITAQAAYTITVSNDNGDASLTLDITVNPATPNLQTLVVAQSYPTGALVSVELVNTGGGELTGCSANNPLPSGLSVARNTGNDSCEITGTPDTVTPADDFEITATNVTGSSLPVTVSIAVVSGVASFATPEALVYAAGDSVNESFANTNTSGGRVTACTSTETLPDGLSVAATAMPGNGCALTGTPTTITEQAAYTITVTNDNGNTTLALDITVNPPVAPNLSAVNAQVYAPNTAITALVLTNTGGGVSASMGCTVDTSDSKPALPTGLSVGVVSSGGKNTCQITGTPVEVVSTARTVTITATNITGFAIVTVAIIVKSGIVPDSLSGQNLFRYEAGRAIPNTRQITFTNTDSVTQLCAETDLPDGMSINSADCTISGKPSRIMAETTTHTITATHTDGTTSEAIIFIETYFSAPPSLSDYSRVTLVVGSAAGLPIVLENTGGLVRGNGCQVISNTGGERPLSDFGLALVVTDDNSSCEIRALNVSPTATVAETRYHITATNDLGVSGAVATLTIIGADAALDAPTLMAPAGSPFMFATNTAITPIDFTPGGGGLGICTISSALPAGLRLDPSTCQISGTPRMALTMTSYTITATNKTSPAATATVVITVTDVASALESMVELALTRNSNVGLPFAIANTGGSPTTCTAAPTTDGDDALDSYNLTTFVASGTCVIDSLDGNGPSRTLDGGSFTITPSNGATTTLALNLRSPATTQIVAGNNRTYAINSAGQLFGWGNNGLNRLGLGNLEGFLASISTPTLFTANDWEQVTSGDAHTCAINISGQLFCWGNSVNGRLGLGNNNNTSTPVRVGDASDWAQINAGVNHTCAIKAPGELFCWGGGAFGQLGLGNNDDDGDGIIDNTNIPMQVGDARDWVQVSAGTHHTCAIKAAGQLWCWGLGSSGRLGLGNNNNTNTPMQVGDASDWRQVSAGVSHTCAIKALGQLWCWGVGSDGELGLGGNDTTNTPMQVGDANDWMQISAGRDHTCAIKAAGQLWCWGAGDNGQLGLGNNNNTNTPMKVGDASDWMQVNAGNDHSDGNDHTCAIRTSGQLWCWGNNDDGQLGLGSNTSTNIPTLVPGILLQ